MTNKSDKHSRPLDSVVVMNSSSTVPTVNMPSSSVCIVSSQEQNTPSIRVPSVLNNSPASGSRATTSIAQSTSTSNKKHSLGYRISRIFFPHFRSTNGNGPSTSSKNKDLESGENQTFLNHNASFYSTSSDGDHHKSNQSSSRRKKHRNQSQQTDALFNALNCASNLERVFDPSKGVYECSICLLEQSISKFPELSTCHHRACSTCMCQYLRVEIYESRVNITCPQCTEPLHPNDIKNILGLDVGLFDKYESFMLRRTLVTDPDVRWCPAPDCDYCVIASGCASCPKLKCGRPGCETLFCYHCKQEWHSNQTCDQARAQRIKSQYGSTSHLTKSGVTFVGSQRGEYIQQHASSSPDSLFLQRDDLKPCPCCRVLIIKMDDGSCNHMTCSVCGTEFCWLCMQKVSDLHYLSPSGCTFWGKKPWSRKKKIMWQLGMLVGAPVGIALIAGIAVPAIIIGIPVWVGRKLYARFERDHWSRRKSNLLVTAGVLTSIFVSPILAAVAVGIGVPILLAYVYGVVPFSLCRSDGCGINSSGMRIAENDNISTNMAPDGVSVDTALSGNHGIGNPSIGELSLGLSNSMSIGSSTHLDRVNLDNVPDRESSSIAACAGSIIAANIVTNASSQTSPNLGNKLDTQVDGNLVKRYSLNSQNGDASSATFSLGDRSVNTNISVDDGSLKVHAGSIRDSVSLASPNYSLSQVEVHVDVGSGDVSNTKSVCIKNSHPNAHQPAINSLVKRFESRSLEYLTNSYCNICHKSHKPCCPNFQHLNADFGETPKNSTVSTVVDENVSNPGKDDEFNNSVCPDLAEQCSSYSADVCDKSTNIKTKIMPITSGNTFKKTSSLILCPRAFEGNSKTNHAHSNECEFRNQGGLTHSRSFTSNQRKHSYGV